SWPVVIRLTQARVCGGSGTTDVNLRWIPLCQRRQAYNRVVRRQRETDEAVDAGEDRHPRGRARHRATALGGMQRASLQHLLAHGWRTVAQGTVVGVVGAAGVLR